MKCLTRSLAFLIVLFATCTFGQAQDEPQIEGLIKNWKQFEKILASANGVKTLNETDTKEFNGESVKLSSKSESRWNTYAPDCFVVVTDGQIATEASPSVLAALEKLNPDRNVRTRKAVGRNSDYSFELDYVPGDDRWVISKIEPNKNTTESNIDYMSKIGFLCNTPLGFHNLTLTTMFLDGSIKMKEVKRDGQFLRIDFSRTTPWLEGYVILDPDNYHVIVNAHVSVAKNSASPKTHHEKSFNYDFTESRPRFPKSESTKYWRDGNSEILEHHYVVEMTTNRSSPSPSEFRLPRFGLPELVPLRNQWRKWIAPATLVLALCIVLSWKSKLFSRIFHTKRLQKIARSK